MPGSPADTPADEATQVFLGHRELLFSVVYNLLGSVADTEDVLQETWLSWARRTDRPASGEIENPRAYLVRIAVNHALAKQVGMSRRRETYVGTWLPEPLVAETELGYGAVEGADRVFRTESLSMALLVVLETLSPLERAVFVLHEVFGYPHTEIAEILGRSHTAVRQTAHRAREHVYARRPRYQTDPQLQRQVTERFVGALLGGDFGALLEILAPEVTLWTDGGGKARAAGLRPVRGSRKVAALIQALAPKYSRDVEIRYRTVNGDPSALLFDGESPFAVLVVDLAPGGDQVQGIYAVTNPDKLSRVS